ncbi:oxidoreductase [Nocardiopsis ansamitocini]|uniref:Oxidoreductase n=1 Tax=Nocardiopsis ansamitocini TaxID=1670832 RepID=A0A9W6P4X2_9ACTN|nr:oxidoreductase [Nocardiopsis ansamitocini]GLU47158.1 oxidoreductase [Nocardiopsis ansamitocini]
MPKGNWTQERLPDQSGAIAVVTGGSSGLGLETAYKLAEAGARVVLTSRGEDKGRAAAREITDRVPGAQVEHARLHLDDLASIRDFAEQFPYERLDLLFNNAGVMDIPLARTADGFEMQFGTNHLGHFALTGLLLPVLLNADAPRVITISSGLHSIGYLDLDDLNWEQRPYNPWLAYGQSKLANLLFTAELDRLAKEADSPLLSVAAHPGYAATNLHSVGGEMRGSRLRGTAMRAANRIFAQSALAGAWPGLYAATIPGVEGGDYYGPRNGRTGTPVRSARSVAARDEATARALWKRSEELTLVSYDFPAAESGRHGAGLG